MGKRVTMISVVVALAMLMAPGVASADASRCPTGVGDIPQETPPNVDWVGYDASYSYDPFWGYHIVDTDACVEATYYFVGPQEAGVVVSADSWLSIYQQSCIFINVEVSGGPSPSYWDAVCTPTGTLP